MAIAALILHLTTLILTIFSVAIIYFSWTYLYWHRRKVPFAEPEIPFGNVREAINGRKNLAIVMKEMYETMKKNGWKHGGFYVFSSPNYCPISLHYIKNIMKNDFNHFRDRSLYCNTKEDPLFATLFNLKGESWLKLRQKLTPTFTPGRIKMMIPLVVECQNFLVQNLKNKMAESEDVDVKELFFSFLTDTVGCCALGLDCNTMSNQSAVFKNHLRKKVSGSRILRLKFIFSSNFPKIAAFFKLKLMPDDVAGFLMETVKKVMDYRSNNNTTRNDFMQTLIDLKEKDGLLNDQQIVSAVFMFYLGGFESTTSLMTFTLYELARNPEIQEKVRKEIDDAFKKHEEKHSYEMYSDMKYLNQVFDEVLRMYPSLPFINRFCVEDYKLPDDDVIIERGTVVGVPIMGIHYDEEYYPTPEKFDPERFSEENKKLRPSYSYLPFGEGPRICIGKRITLMFSKIGLSGLLRQYKFSISDKTLQPMEFEPKSVTLSPKGGKLFLRVEKL